MNESDELNLSRGVHGPSFVLGLVGGALLGVIASVAFATYQEEKFGQVVRKTREIGDGAQEKVEAARDKAMASVNGVTTVAKEKASRATKVVAHKVGEVAGDVERLTKDVRLAVDPESEA